MLYFYMEDAVHAEPEYLKEARRIFEKLLLEGGASDEFALRKDIVKLIKAKHLAHSEGSLAFEGLLLDMARVCDEEAHAKKKSGHREFKSIAGYFGRYDRMLSTMGRLVISDVEFTEEWLKGLVENKEKFDGLEKGLFNRLFIKDLLTNKYISAHGKKKLRIIAEGLDEISEGRSTPPEVLAKFRKTLKEKFPFKESFS